MKHRILFVDDEPLVLQGMERALRSMRDEWEMAFVGSGPQALDRMAKSPFDAVVTDMRMPGMTGAELLGEVMAQHPMTARLILSAQTDEALLLRCVGTAHQFLAKPCGIAALKMALARAFTAGTSLNNPRLRDLVCRLDRLPSLPSLYLEVLKLVQDPDVELGEIAAVVSRDIAMAAKILKLANSAYFGLRREVNDIHEAVTFLGIETIKTLVLTIHAFSQFEEGKAGGFPLDRLWAHSLEVAATARRIAEIEQTGAAVIEQSFIGGMLHDIGQLILAANPATGHAAVIQASRAGSHPLHQAERDALGTTHAEVGGYMLGLWGLPAPVVEAISLHHEPRLSQGTAFSALTAVHVAETLHPAGIEVPDGSSAEPVDLVYLDRLGLTGRLPEWTTDATHPPQSHP